MYPLREYVNDEAPWAIIMLKRWQELEQTERRMDGQTSVELEVVFVNFASRN